jgi:hypothetical protein
MGNAVPVSPSTLVREVGHATDELIQTTYGHLTRKRVNDTRLDYGDDPVDLKARAERAAELMSEAVKQGLAKAKRRRAEEKALESEDGVLRIRLDDDGGELKGRRPREKGRFVKAAKPVMGRAAESEPAAPRVQLDDDEPQKGKRPREKGGRFTKPKGVG